MFEKEEFVSYILRFVQMLGKSNTYSPKMVALVLTVTYHGRIRKKHHLPKPPNKSTSEYIITPYEFEKALLL